MSRKRNNNKTTVNKNSHLNVVSEYNGIDKFNGDDEQPKSLNKKPRDKNKTEVQDGEIKTQVRTRSGSRSKSPRLNKKKDTTGKQPVKRKLIETTPLAKMRLLTTKNLSNSSVNLKL